MPSGSARTNADETRLRTPEEETLALVAQDRKRDQPQRTLEDTYRTACAFLANPKNLWANPGVPTAQTHHGEHKRMVLRPVFGGP